MKEGYRRQNFQTLKSMLFGKVFMNRLLGLRLLRGNYNQTLAMKIKVFAPGFVLGTQIAHLNTTNINSAVLSLRCGLKQKLYFTGRIILNIPIKLNYSYCW